MPDGAPVTVLSHTIGAALLQRDEAKAWRDDGLGLRRGERKDLGAVISDDQSVFELGSPTAILG